MKKKLFISISIVILVVVLVCLLFNKKDGILLCTNTVNKNDVLVKNRYEILYEDGYVVSVISNEDIVSDDKDTLGQYKDLLESMYKPYNEIKYYSNEIRINGDTLNSITKINYRKISKDELVAVDRNNASLYYGDRVPVKKLRKVYKNMGARCRKS